MVEIEHVSFSYGNEENSKNLTDIDFMIHSGECVLLCGASGCGKTTITKLVNGLIPHFQEGKLEGCTRVDGMEVKDLPLYELSQKVGSVFQNPKSQFFNIDSDSELAFGLENNGVDPSIIRERLDRVVKDMNIQHLLHRNVFSMSGGEKQTLAFASVYAMNPDVYVLDEPSANLDQKATENLREQIRMIKEQGKTIIVAEHRLSYLADLIDRAVLIQNGKIRKEYTREAFLQIPEPERHKMGLRTVFPQTCRITERAKETGVLQVKNLTVKRKKKIIFENLSFAVSPGMVLGILGHNGAGKSTLLRCIAGLQKEASGEIFYEGKKLSRKQRNKLCYMMALDEFHLLELKEKHPMALSGGQKQRLAIVTGILAGKKVLMFDEPSSGLDYEHMCRVSSTLRKLSDAGCMVLVVTHDLELLNRTCDQILTF